MKFKLQYVDGIRLPATPSLFLGKSCHRALEVFYRHRMLGVTLDAGEVAGRLEESWGQMVEDEQMAFGSADDEQSVKKQTGDLVRAYIAGVPADEPRPLAVEAAMEAPLVDPATGEDFGIPLVGIVDLVLDGDNQVILAAVSLVGDHDDASSYVQVVRSSCGLTTCSIRPAGS